ncbi:MAG: DUF4252 domain-containing protein [Rikenellaceae bacterium]|nr:DUF4252 domain-containing protein [Rikenellaceae bacterium]
MKKFIVLIAMLLPLGAMATVPELNKIVDNYSTTEGVTVVNLTGEMLKAQAGAAGADANKYIEDIESLVILQSETADLSKKIVKQVDKALKGVNLESLVDIQAEKDNRVRVLANRDGEVIADIIVFVTEGDEVALIMISGTLDESILGDMQSGIGGISIG